jgi:hypothetical protein
MPEMLFPEPRTLVSAPRLTAPRTWQAHGRAGATMFETLFGFV